MYHRGVHIFALLTAAATFPLIFMGGLVTSHVAGMSVPDWPNSYGYNMFLFPPRLWVGGILYEHTHRLMGTVVGMLSILLTVWAWRFEERAWVRGLCTAVLGAVIFQGVLGGLRVVLVKLDLAIVHACFAQAFFCLAALAAIATSKWWMQAPDLSQSDASLAGRRLIALGVFACVAIYVQLIVGATMRHYDAGLAVPDLPLAYGKVIPATDAASLDQINRQRAWKMDLKPVTASQIWLHMGHRVGAIIVTLVILLAAGIVLMKHRGESALLRPTLLVLALLIAQVTLGVLTVIKRKPADIASLHVAVGALTLVTTFVLTVRAARLFARRPMARSIAQAKSEFFELATAA